MMYQNRKKIYSVPTIRISVPENEDILTSSDGSEFDIQFPAPEDWFQINS